MNCLKKSALTVALVLGLLAGACGPSCCYLKGYLAMHTSIAYLVPQIILYEYFHFGCWIHRHYCVQWAPAQILRSTCRPRWALKSCKVRFSYG